MTLLGPFELGEKIGEGGMGAVYLARHAETGQPVAVKVLLSDEAREPESRRRFRREVQALAKLHHPAIAAIVDYGEIDEFAARNGPDAFVRGAPWFAMEYVDGPAVKNIAAGWRWDALQGFLGTTLDALAHAHARSVIHRDLKLANILVEESGAGDVEGRQIKLVDFGIARLLDPDTTSTRSRSERPVGTPEYMAPEQIRGNWRDQGPWTDLYALGCLTWRIVCGVPPFDGNTTEEVLESHIGHRLGAFDPRFPVPEGLDDWLGALLRHDVERRTRRAADAAWGLARLGEPKRIGDDESIPLDDQAGATIRVQPTLGDLTQTLRDVGAPTMVDDLPESFEDGSPASEFDGGGDVCSQSANSVPPILPDWRRDHPVRRAAVLPRAGLQLFALREVPMVDRDAERDRLWRALHRVHNHGGPHLVTLEANAGAGKSRLAQWLCQRARETGAAQVLTATHTPSSAPDAGLRGMVRRLFRTTGLSRSDVYGRLLERLPALDRNDEMRIADARALTELLHPVAEDATVVDGPRYRFSSPDHKYALIRRLLTRFAAERPLVVWLDDLQWGRDSIGALEEFLETGEYVPSVLLVATVRSDVVAERGALRARLSKLYETAEAERIRLTPLGADDHRELIDRLLHLEPRLAESLADRTEGNPLFAIQLLRDWVDRGLLEVGGRGFGLPTDADTDVPDDIHELWLERIQRVIDKFTRPSDRLLWTCFERAATLGRENDDTEWRAVCDDVGVEHAAALRDALIKRGLAERTDDGWAFAHGLLVDSLERHARDHARWKDHHRRCADLLVRLYPDRSRQTAGRRAAHRREAGQLEEALEALSEEYERVRTSGDPRVSQAVAEDAIRLLDEMDAPEDHPHRLEAEMRAARCRLITEAAPERTLEVLRDVRDRAEAAGHERNVVLSWRWEANCQRRCGNYIEASECARRAVERAESAGAHDVRTGALLTLGWAERVRGRLDDAERHIEQARKQSKGQEEHYSQLQTRRELALISIDRGEEQQAVETFAELLEESQRHGYRAMEVLCLNALGEYSRFRGDAASARDYYRRFRRGARELNRMLDLALSYINLALVELMDRKFEVAAEQLEEAEHRLSKATDASARANLLRAARLALAAGTGDWPTYDDILRCYADGWPEDARLIRDHPWLLEMAGDYAHRADQLKRGARAWDLAERLWRRIDDRDAAQRVAEKKNSTP